jgi:hypothetical protein
MSFGHGEIDRIVKAINGAHFDAFLLVAGIVRSSDKN